MGYRSVVDAGQPTAAERERSYHAIRRAAAAIDVVRPGAIETAAFLLNEAKTSFERTLAESANIESKATTVLGIVAAATGALGVFGTRDGKLIVATPLVTAATSCVLASLVCLLYILRAKRFASLDVGSYISAATVQEDNRLGLSLVLAELYRQIRDESARHCALEGRALFAAYGAIVAASILLLVNAVGGGPGTAAQSHVVSSQTGTSAPAAKP